MGLMLLGERGVIGTGDVTGCLQMYSGLDTVHRNIEKEIQETIGAGFEVQTAKRHPQDTKAVRGEGQRFAE